MLLVCHLDRLHQAALIQQRWQPWGWSVAGASAPRFWSPAARIHDHLHLPCAGAGVVAQVGADVTGWKEGDRVTAAPWTYAELGHGTWQEYALVHADHLVPHLGV
jgi:hypothetical protein